MAERSKAAVLKTVVDESPPRVRIPIPPLTDGVLSVKGESDCGGKTVVDESPPRVLPTQSGLSLRCASKYRERCQSGRSYSFAKAAYRKVPRVRIPPSPPDIHPIASCLIERKTEGFQGTLIPTYVGTNPALSAGLRYDISKCQRNSYGELAERSIAAVY